MYANLAKGKAARIPMKRGCYLSVEANHSHLPCLCTYSEDQLPGVKMEYRNYE